VFLELPHVSEAKVQCGNMASPCHIDFGRLQVSTESDVEQKILMPLLTGQAYLAIPTQQIHTKEYLAPTKLDKAGGKTTGYYPDYSVWGYGFALMIAEAKSPDVPVEEGYREASLYARHLNQNYPTDLNPSRFVLACNGKELLCGYWDSSAGLRIKVEDLTVGSLALQSLKQYCGITVLEEYGYACLRRIASQRARFPFELAGGQALLNAKLPVNSFAADLSPILRRYFSNQEDVHEIVRKAYVDSSEVTEYDRVLESLLKERLSVHRDSIIRELQPDRKGEQTVAETISEFDKSRPEQGQLQIVQGAVGSGKSLFMHRYHDMLQPDDAAKRTRWAFVDFNAAPPDLATGYRWLCSAFIEDFSARNSGLDLYSAPTLRGVFSRNIQKRKAAYDLLDKASTSEGAAARARDLMAWEDDPAEMARGIAEYVLGGRQDVLIAVLDNVDRLELKDQLAAFQLALYFMAQTKAFVVLQMRDETYERYKNKPPLDTFRSGITFHISPPRFIDVVKRRLELSLDYLSSQARDLQSYSLPTGLRISYPKSALGTFLNGLYLELFGKRSHNVPRILEALAGGDIRKALEMFVSIITSGHLSTTEITSNVIGGSHHIKEHNILKILMRTDYRFASEHSGVVANILHFDRDWQKPDNFLLSEALYYLVMNRKRRGQIGMEGYWTCAHVANELQRLGYMPADVLLALNYLLGRRLIIADHFGFREVDFNDAVRTSAAGFMHLRFMPSRLEYLYGILPTTPLFDEVKTTQIARYVERESSRGFIPLVAKAEAVGLLYDYLFEQRRLLREKQPFSPEQTGADLILKQINNALQHHWHGAAAGPEPGTELDLAGI